MLIIFLESDVLNRGATLERTKCYVGAILRNDKLIENFVVYLQRSTVNKGTSVVIAIKGPQPLLVICNDHLKLRAASKNITAA